MLAKLRGLVLALLLLAGLWALFLVSAHLLLDFEQKRGAIPAVVHFKTSTPIHGTLDENEDDLDDWGGNSDLTDDDHGALHRDCEIPEDDKFPDCYNQVKRLRRNWADDVCYREYDVDGSDCSILIYLSEVESWCPRLPSRLKDTEKKQRKRTKATLRAEQDLLVSRVEALPGTEVLQGRISHMSAHWDAAVPYMEEQKVDAQHRNIKRVLAFVGNLTGKALTDDMITWADLLTALHLLGHDVTVVMDTEELLSLLTQGRQTVNQGCSGNSQAGFDLIYLDQEGLQNLVLSSPNEETTARIWDNYSCRVRVLAPFGVDAEFDYRDYQGNIAGEIPSTGRWNLPLRQFLTKFPLSPDNSFLGFAIASRRNLESSKKKGVAFVHAKRASDLKRYESYLSVLYKQGIRLHTALDQEHPSNNASFPPFVVDLGFPSADEIKSVLQKSKILLGLKMPYEGILPLEAVARGSVFINPKFVPARHRLNSKSLRKLPSSRKLSSQHPYASMFIGEPHVYTIDIANLTEVSSVLKRILNDEVSPLVPFEFTCEGMLERLNAYIEHQDFCGGSNGPLNDPNFEVFMGEPGETCTDLCFHHGLVCEPQFFRTLNSSRISDCRTSAVQGTPVAPAVNATSKQCVFQAQPLLYSCAAGHPAFQRFCPCRKFREGQIAMALNGS